MSELWGMVVLVIALLIGNLWLLKRNSKQQLKRKTTVSRPVQPAQTAAAVQTSPVIVSTSEKNPAEAPATGKPSADVPTHSSTHASGDSDGGAD